MGKIITKYHHKGTPRSPAKGELYARNFSNGEIVKRAQADPDTRILTGEELAQFKPVNRFVKKL